MTHTTNYNLNKFEATDRVTRDGFNDNADAIDAALKANADAAGAAQSTANAASSAAGAAQSTANTALAAAQAATAAATTAAVVKLKTIAATTDVLRLDIDISDIDMDAYDRLWFTAQFNRVASNSTNVLVRLDDYAAENYLVGSYPREYAASLINSAADKGDEIVVQLMRNDHEVFVTTRELTYYHTSSVTKSGATDTYATLKRSYLTNGWPETVNFVSSSSSATYGNAIGAGSRVTVYGLRK